MSSSTRPVLEEVQAANEEIVEIERKLEEINHQLATREDYESDSYMQLLTDINELNEEFVLKGGQGVGEQAEMILKGLGHSFLILLSVIKRTMKICHQLVYTRIHLFRHL